MIDTYQGIYSVLSSDTHNDLLRVESRHLVRNPGKTTIYFENQWTLADVQAPILTLPGILSRSLDEIFIKFDVNKYELIKNKHEETIEELNNFLDN